MVRVNEDDRSEFRFEGFFASQYHTWEETQKILIDNEFEDYSDLSRSLVLAMKAFCLKVAQGNLAPDLVPKEAYSKDTFAFGSVLEAVFAVFINCITLDEQGAPINCSHAELRAAEMLMCYYPNSNYEPARPFLAWEVELC